MAFANEIRRQKQIKVKKEINTQKNDCTDLAKFKVKMCMKNFIQEKVGSTGENKLTVEEIVEQKLKEKEEKKAKETKQAEAAMNKVYGRMRKAKQ